MKIRKMRVVIGGLIASLLIANIATPVAYACEPNEIPVNEVVEDNISDFETSEEPSRLEEPEIPEINQDDMYIPAPENESEERLVIVQEEPQEVVAENPSEEPTEEVQVQEVQVQEVQVQEVPEEPIQEAQVPEVKEVVEQKIEEQKIEEQKAEEQEPEKETEPEINVKGMFISVSNDQQGTSEEEKEEPAEKEEPVETEITENKEENTKETKAEEEEEEKEEKEEKEEAKAEEVREENKENKAEEENKASENEEVKEEKKTTEGEEENLEENTENKAAEVKEKKEETKEEGKEEKEETKETESKDKEVKEDKEDKDLAKDEKAKEEKYKAKEAKIEEEKEKAEIDETKEDKEAETEEKVENKETDKKEKQTKKEDTKEVETEEKKEESEENEETPKVINTYCRLAIDGKNTGRGEVLITYEVLDNGTVKRTRSDMDGNVYMEEIFEGEDYDKIVAAIEKRQNELRILEEADSYAKVIEDLDIDELVDLYLNMSTAQADNWKPGPEGAAGADGEKSSKGADDYILEKAEQVAKEATKKTVDKFIKMLPENELYSDTLKGIVYGIFGIDDKAPSLKDVMNQNSADAKELRETIQKEIDIAKKENIDVTTIENYGKTLDDFTNQANRRAKTIITIKDNDKLTEAQKVVQIAELVGNASDWRTGNNSGNIIVAMEAAASSFKGGSDTDIESRDLYNVIYEFKTHDSLFSGEAMNRSEGLIQKRVQGFIRNCGVVMECFKAHQEVLKLTDEQVASLDPGTRAIYDRIKSDNDSIAAQFKNIITIFFGNEKSPFEDDHTGIFTAAESYYNKEKTVYIDQGTKNIRLSDKLLETHGSDYTKADHKGVDTDAIDAAVTKSGLTKADIDKIVARAKAKNMTIKEYLEYCGFDTNNMKIGVLASGSFEEKYKPVLGGFYGEGYDYTGVEGYYTKNFGTGHLKIDANEHTQRALFSDKVVYGLWVDWGNDKKDMNQELNIYTFQAK